MRIIWSLLLFLMSVPGWCAASEARVAAKTLTLPIVDAIDIRFASISTSDGLSQSRVTNIVQDDLGFLWFGTQYGLNRFDGYDFKVFVHEPGNRDSLSGVNVIALRRCNNLEWHYRLGSCNPFRQRQGISEFQMEPALFGEFFH